MGPHLVAQTKWIRYVVLTRICASGISQPCIQEPERAWNIRPVNWRRLSSMNFQGRRVRIWTMITGTYCCVKFDRKSIIVNGRTFALLLMSNLKWTCVITRRFEISGYRSSSGGQNTYLWLTLWEGINKIHVIRRVQSLADRHRYYVKAYLGSQ